MSVFPDKHKPDPKALRRASIYFTPELIKRIDEIAKERGISRNEAMKWLVLAGIHQYEAEDKRGGDHSK